jgi:hypothetical protein
VISASITSRPASAAHLPKRQPQSATTAAGIEQQKSSAFGESLLRLHRQRARLVSVRSIAHP